MENEVVVFEIKRDVEYVIIEKSRLVEVLKMAEDFILKNLPIPSEVVLDEIGRLLEDSGYAPENNEN